MTTPPPNNSESLDQQTQRILIGVLIGFAVVVLLLVGLAIFLMFNAARFAPSVEILRDFLITLMAMMMIVIGVALVVLLVQVARLVNLLNNEIQPLIDNTQETVNIVRGTAIFLSKYLADPVVAANAQVRGVVNVVREVNAIRDAIKQASSDASNGSQPS